jgi:hypothetical protein
MNESATVYCNECETEKQSCADCGRCHVCCRCQSGEG